MGTYLADCVGGAFRRHGLPLQGAKILDFACGPGRVTREVKRLLPASDLSGSDIDEEAIAWAQSNLAWAAEFSTNAPMPPTRYPGDCFDGVFSISLFTHLDEESQERWLGELERILRPGGILVATTHGRFATASCSSDETRLLHETGFAFRIGHKGRFKLDGLPDSYQTAFHTREYVERVWGKFFALAEHVPGGVGQHQDLVVLQKRRMPAVDSNE